MDLFFLTVDNVVMRKTSVSVFPIKERYFFDNLEGVPGGTDDWKVECMMETQSFIFLAHDKFLCKLCFFQVTTMT